MVHRGLGFGILSKTWVGFRIFGEGGLHKSIPDWKF